MTTELDIVNATDELQLAIVAMLEPGDFGEKRTRMRQAETALSLIVLNVVLDAVDRMAEDAP